MARINENFRTHVHFKIIFSDNQRMETVQPFRWGSEKDDSIYREKWHILSNSIEMSKKRLSKPNRCFTFKTKEIVQSATVATKK